MRYSVRDLRNQKGWTQQRLAHEAGITQATVSTLEAGRRQPNMDSLQKIAKALGVSIDGLIEGDSRSDEIRYIERVFSQIPEEDKERIMLIIRTFER